MNAIRLSSLIAATMSMELTAATHIGRAPMPWIGAALALYLVAIVITFAIHLPLNDAIKAAGAPDRIADLADVRNRFHKARWVSWNLVRAATTTSAFGCLAWSLVLSARTPESPR